METFRDDRHCFVCGEKNEAGLRLNWDMNRTADCLTTSFRPDERWQGWRGVVHGGIVSAVLDEAMVNYTILRFELGVVSAELTVRFKDTAPIEDRLVFEGEAERRNRKLFAGESRCYRAEDETVVAQATSKLMRVEAEVPELWQNE